MAQAANSRGADARTGSQRLRRLERVTEELRTLARDGHRAADVRRRTASTPPLVAAIRAWEHDLAAARQGLAARARDTRAEQD
jgi:hypothetical protein